MPTNEDASSDDEFFDAVEYFDQELLDLLDMNQRQKAQDRAATEASRNYTPILDEIQET